MTPSRDYHGQPILKEPTWTWEIPIYFFTGGMAGASSGLAFLSELAGEEMLARRAWAVGLCSVGISPVLLISDLGKPARFLNMLRVFKVTSPMSVGSWVLSGAGATTALAAANAWTGLLRRPARVARPAAGLLGMPLATYTAALLGATSIPAWHEARRILPFVFASGAAASAGGVVTAVTPPRHAGAARRLAVGAAAVEIALTEVMHRRLGELDEPYQQGQPRVYASLSRSCLAAGATLLTARGAGSRPAAIAGGALVAAGALAARWSVYKAGFRSASDPKYVVGPQRARVARGDSRGAARTDPQISPSV